MLVAVLGRDRVGIAILAAAVAPNLPLQLAAKPTMRGRVMALWALAWLGSTPIGGPIVGWVAQEAGARWSLVIGGLPALIAIDRRVAARRVG